MAGLGEAGFEIEDKFTSEVEALIREFPQEVKKFMQKEGRKAKRVTDKKAASLTKTRTGTYRKGIKVGKFYKYQNKVPSIRVYGKARYSSPLEVGHGMPYSKGRKSEDKTERNYMVKGRHVFETAKNEFETTYGEDCEKFADELVAKLE